MKKSNFLFAVLVFVSSVNSGAAILRLQKDDVQDISLTGKVETRCRSSVRAELWTLSVTTRQGNFVREACLGLPDYHTALKEMDQIKSLIEGPQVGATCIKSEDCFGRRCQRVYGRSQVVEHELILYSKGATPEIEAIRERKIWDCL